MFKLKKILNKHNNAPEPETLPVAGNTIADVESIYYFQQGELIANLYDETETPIYYVVYKNVGQTDFNRTVECVRVTPDMVFEVKCSGAPYIGDRIALKKSEDETHGFDYVKTVGPTEESDGHVVDISAKSKTGKVLVRLHCKQ